MKIIRLTFLFLVIISFSNCVKPYYYPTYGKISTIPTLPHQKETTIFYKNEEPKKDFFIAALLSIDKEDAPSHTKRLRLLQKQAQLAGADAIILEGNKEDKNELKGMGIKYWDNLDYIHLFPKKETAYLYDEKSSTYNLVATTLLDFKGNPTSIKGLKYIHPRIKRFSEQHLIKEQSKNWSYYLDRYDRVTRRVLKINDTVIKELSFYYGSSTDKNALIEEIQVFHYGDLPQGYGKISFRYNQKQQVSEKIISWFNKPIERELISYDEKGRIAELEIRKFGKKGREIKHIKAIYEYYVKEDLKKLTSLGK